MGAPTVLGSGRGPTRAGFGPGLIGYLVALGRTYRQWLEGSPGRLRRLGAVGVLGALLAGGGGAVEIVVLAGALDRAEEALIHRNLLQSARVELFRADADAAGAFLLGGLEPTDQRRRFLASVSAASGNLVQAAGTGPADGRYVQINRALTEYSGLIETARISNRQGLAVGASYLQIGSGLLNRSVLPAVGAMAGEDSVRADTAFTQAIWAAAGFVGCVLAGGALLALGQYRLALLTRSVLTVPAAATAVVLALVALVVAIMVLLAAQQSNRVRGGDVRRVADLVEARAGGFEARAAENLTLVARGSRPEGERTWQSAADRVLEVTRDTAAEGGAGRFGAGFERYRDLHVTLAEADADGAWPEAVRLATDRGPDSLVAAFDVFDTDSAAVLAEVSQAADAGLDSARAGLGWNAAAMALAGVVAAVGMAIGTGRRLGEYR